MERKELHNTFQKLKDAVCAEDVFGIPEASAHANQELLQSEIKKIYLQLVKAVHPDRYAEDEESFIIAGKAFSLLTHFYDMAKKKISELTYGQTRDEAESVYDFQIRTVKHIYSIYKSLSQGDLSTIYSATIVGGELESNKVVIKIADDPADNDLLRNELRTLNLFQQEASRYHKHLPYLLDNFLSSEGQVGIVLREINGYDLHTIREKYKQGIDPRHIIWIFRRLLSVIGYAHSLGIIHGNIEPTHILISPKDHNVFLIDWSYAILKPALTGQGFRVFNEVYSGPEVGDRKPPLPASDLFSAGKCMIYLLGGNPETNELPVSIDDRLRRMLLFFVRTSPLQRAQDAWVMYQEIDKLREEIYGPHKFIEFPWD